MKQKKFYKIYIEILEIFIQNISRKSVCYKSREYNKSWRTLVELWHCENLNTNSVCFWCYAEYRGANKDPGISILNWGIVNALNKKPSYVFKINMVVFFLGDNKHFIVSVIGETLLQILMNYDWRTMNHKLMWAIWIWRLYCKWMSRSPWYAFLKQKWEETVLIPTSNLVKCPILLQNELDCHAIYNLLGIQHFG